MREKVWRTALAALGLGALAASAKPVTPAKEPAAPMGRCQRYYDNGAGYEFTQIVREAQLKFGFELHRKIDVPTPNRLTSPVSAYTVMAMLTAGAKGTTLDELKQTLFGNVAVSAGIDGTAATVAALECPNEYRSTIFTAANRMFLGKGVAVLPDFAAALKKTFNLTAGEVDFGKAAEAAEKINQWVSDETRGNIKELVSSSSITANMRLVLVNALYIMGTWAEKFDAQNTQPKPFLLENGKKITVPMMAQRHEYPKFNYAKLAHYEALGMDFADHLAEVFILLPNKGTPLRKVMNGLDATEFANLEKHLDRRPIDLALPKFKISGGASLVTALQAMGVKHAFSSEKADFSGIDGGQNLLYVAEVLQKATAKVDEMGFEGAAATAAMMAAGAAPPKPSKPIPFHVDRPFGFVVLHRQSGGVLFVGEVRDPR